MKTTGLLSINALADAAVTGDHITPEAIATTCWQLGTALTNVMTLLLWMMRQVNRITPSHHLEWLVAFARNPSRLLLC